MIRRALLVFVAVWPAVTLGLQRWWDVDPWKLMSFGMYATPPRRPAELIVRAEVLRNGVWVPVALDAEAFARDRQALGELASVEPLLRQLPAPARITVISPRIDGAATSIYERPGVQ